MPDALPLQRPLRISAVVCAYNEERNLPNLLTALLGFRDDAIQLREIVIVASGCTDGTLGVLSTYAAEDSRVRLHVEGRRTGKAAAMDLGFRMAREAILLVENADTVPAPGAIAHLLRPFVDPDVTLVCSHPVPANRTPGWTVSVGRTLWEIHDRLARSVPKVGEAFAVRRAAARSPPDVEDDDTFIGAFAVGHGGRSLYVPEAVIFNRVPERADELFRQRLRINRQIVRLARRTGIVSVGWSPAEVAGAVARYFREHPDRLPELLTLAALELTVRLLALADPTPRGRRLSAWAPLPSTKAPIDDPTTAS